MDGKECLVGLEEWEYDVDEELEEEDYDCHQLGFYLD